MAFAVRVTFHPFSSSLRIRKTRSETSRNSRSPSGRCCKPPALASDHVEADESDLGFSYRVAKSGDMEISRNGRVVTRLRGKQAAQAFAVVLGAEFALAETEQQARQFRAGLGAWRHPVAGLEVIPGLAPEVVAL